MYNGIQTVALERLVEAQQDCEVEEIVFTGHSLGAVMCCLLALDVMADDCKADSIPRLSTHLPLKLVLFGCPRFGNPVLAQFWEHTISSYERRHGEASVNEYSVRGFNDGVPTLPPHFLGYRHAVKKVYYSAHGTLYSIPPSESEYTIFKIDDDPDTKTRLIKHPRGGHLYYNDRNMELLLRRMHWIQNDVSIFGEAECVKRYHEHFLRKAGETGSSSASLPTSLPHSDCSIDNHATSI
jgi:predicted alpha/beta-fold hydrolase